MKRITTVILFALALLWQANLSHGAGFLIYEHGAAAMAMAGAFISVANDPSAIFHNPAGIAFLKGTQLSFGTTLIVPTGSMDLTRLPFWEPTKKHWEQEKQVYYPSNVYFTQSLGDKVTFGFGFFSPFGLGSKWPIENQLRYLGYEDDMKTFFFNPVLGFKLSERVSLGLGFSYIYSTAKFKLVKGPYGEYDVPTALDGRGHSWNFNAGLLYRGEKFSFGLNYRSRFDIVFDGDISLDLTSLPAPLKPLFPTSAKAKTTFRFPDILGVGVSFNVTKKLLLSADAHYVLWSRFNEYEVEFFDQDQGLPLETMVMEENFKDSWIWRAGLQYMVTPKFALRGGYLWDKTPQPEDTMDPLLPDTDRYAIIAGFGYTFGKIVLDFAYHYEVFSDRLSPNRYALQVGAINYGESTYDLSANLFALSLSFVF